MTETQPGAAKRPPDPATGRRRDRRSRAAILRATVDLLNEVGYQGVTMEGVASRAGVGKATVYRWWPTKASLVIEAMTERLPLTPVPETGDTRADLRAAIRTAISTLTGLPTGVVIPALVADLVNDPEAAAQFRDFLRPRRASVLTILDHAAERGELPADVDTALLFDLYAGTILYRSLISGEPIGDALVDQLVELLIDGRAPRAADRHGQDSSTGQPGGDAIAVE